MGGGGHPAAFVWPPEDGPCGSFIKGPDQERVNEALLLPTAEAGVFFSDFVILSLSLNH